MKKLMILFLAACLLAPMAQGVLPDPVSQHEFENGYNPTFGTAVGIPLGGASISSAQNETLIGSLGGSHTTGDVLDVHGDGNYLQIGNDDVAGITSAITITAWIQASNSNWTRMPMSRNYNWNFVSAGNAQMGFKVDHLTPSKVDSVTDVHTDRAWHHVAGVYDGTDLKVYVDGLLDNTVATGGGLVPDDATSLYALGMILKDNAGVLAPSKSWDGYIDDARVYDVALNADQVYEVAYGIPEPMTITLLGLGAGLLIRRRR